MYYLDVAEREEDVVSELILRVSLLVFGMFLCTLHTVCLTFLLFHFR